MTDLTIAANGQLEITPSATSAHTDFDFFNGTWKVHNRRLKTRLKQCDEWLTFDADLECHSILNGYGNTDQIITELQGAPFHGTTFRLFNPKTRLWSLYWADSVNVVLDVPQVGSFAGPIGRFYARDTHQGTPVIVVFEWNRADPQRPTWQQAFSVDNGLSWEWNWYMTYDRLAG